MIWMNLIMLPGVKSEHNVWSALAQHKRQFAAQGDGRLNFAVVVMEEGYIGDSQHVSSRQLFCFANGGQPFGGHTAFVAAAVATGCQDIFQSRACSGVAGNSTRAAKFGIIRM